ncbi:MAG: hypothetical protein ABJG47_14175 [Ekhidna sp.]
MEKYDIEKIDDEPTLVHILKNQIHLWAKSGNTDILNEAIKFLKLYEAEL